MKRFPDILPTLIVYDFDGVMTDNRVIVSETGEESAVVNRSDGLAVALIRDELGIRQIIVSTEENPLVRWRAKKLGIEVIHGVSNKASTIADFAKTNGIKLSDVLMIGNDINDLEALKMCGYSGCPSDAEVEVLEVVDFAFARKGGEGVVRELYRLLTGGALR